MSGVWCLQCVATWTLGWYNHKKKTDFGNAPWPAKSALTNTVVLDMFWKLNFRLMPSLMRTFMLPGGWTPQSQEITLTLNPGLWSQDSNSKSSLDASEGELHRRSFSKHFVTVYNHSGFNIRELNKKRNLIVSTWPLFPPHLAPRKNTWWLWVTSEEMSHRWPTV